MNTSAPATEHKLKLTSAEIANIWTNYINDTLAICTINAFLSHMEDIQIKSVLEFAMQLSKAHIQKLTILFTEEQLPIPEGFSEEKDFYKDTPRLFTDDFYLFYIQNIGKLGMTNYALSLSNSARLDICEYFTECLNESTKLFNKATEVMLSKGTFIRSPYIPDYHKVEFVQKQTYFAGLWGDRRPLNVIDMTNIYFNLIQNQLGRTLLMGFSQVAQSQKVREYMIRGRDISDKHVEIFGSILSKEYLPSSSAWDILPTDSTISPFSDKLMMFHVTMLIAAGISFYGTSLSRGPRHDLGANYLRLLTEIALYAEDGANIMIDNGWMEQAPQGVDRDKLANANK